MKHINLLGKIMPALMVGLLLAGCAGKKQHSPPSTGADGPGWRLKTILLKAARGDYGALYGEVIYARVAALDMDFMSAEEWTDRQKSSFWKALTGGESLVEVRVLSERIQGRFAVVKVSLVFRDGSRRPARFEMQQFDGGRWVLPVYEKMLKELEAP
ncbi:MAG TPA: hypothetical protein ENN21_04230 [Spirochaetes bacterium]|nr:hypothetical protein [Spirochaetota bacterium]